MKIIVAVSLAIMAIASMAYVAQASNCSDINYQSGYFACLDCCKGQGMRPGKGRSSFVVPGQNICKCLSEEEFQAELEKWEDQKERELAKREY